MHRIHFIGIGGVGMNGLAQLAVRSGYYVSGSDRGYERGSGIYGMLENLGIRIYPQDGSGIDADTEKVIFSTAIEDGNPDLVQAQEMGVPLLHRAEFLKELIGHDTLIAVAGTAGKTTTTGLLGWIFEYMGLDPSVYNGAAVLNWKSESCPGNIRKGDSDLWVIEADESDRSLLNFEPTHSIITNISKDHFELDELHRMFDRFEEQTSGTTIRGDVEDEAAMHLDPATIQNVLPGRHNLQNALCAMRLCCALGMKPDDVMEAIAEFKGIERRLECVGRTNDITIIDDYAHNPAKIAASLSATMALYDKVHVYWRPHGYRPLHQMRDDLIRVFREISPASLFILPVYFSGGTAERKTTAADLVAQLDSTGVTVELVPDFGILKLRLQQMAEPGDAILGMGARDPELPLFARRLVSEWMND